MDAGLRREMRQNKQLEPRSDAIGAEKALDHDLDSFVFARFFGKTVSTFPDRALGGAGTVLQARWELAGPAQSDAEYVRDRVRSGDQDRYWAALLAPEAARAGLLALYAFNLEIAQIPEQVSEPQLGEIRLEWWREALSGALSGGMGDHPVMKPLAAAISAHALPPGLLEGMIDARSFDLAREPMPDFAALRAYLLATAGAVFRLGARIAGAPDAAGPASDHAALAYGLTGLMRALPYHTARGQIFIPADLLSKHGLHPQILLDGEDNQDVRAMLRDLLLEAFAALQAARQALRPMRGGMLAPFLPLALVEPYLKALGAPGHHPLRDIAQINPLRRYGLIWRAHLRGRV